jgi:hypothetical protein
MLLDRRQLLKRMSLVMGGALSAPVASGVLAGCRARVVPAGAPGAVLDGLQLRVAGALAERILPRTLTPGALDAGVDGYIDVMLADFFSEDERRVYLNGLGRLDRRARERHGSGFADCAPQDQDALVAALDQRGFATVAGEGDEAAVDDPDAVFCRLHKELTIAGFYTSEVGQTQELEPMPIGEFRANVPIGPDHKVWA